MISLFMDTHSKDLNIGLVNDNILLDEVKIKDLETHSNLFLLKVKEILKKHNLTPNEVDKIIVINGPGSFTGIRIAVTCAKVFAWGLKKRIVTISSLKSYALSTNFKDFVIPVIDARRGYVYASIYDNNFNEILEEKYMLLSELLDIVRQRRKMLRQANEEDACYIVNLLNTYSDNVHIDISYIKSDILNNDYSYYYIYDIDGLTVAMINFHKMNGYAEIIDIVVLKEYGHMGIATSLLNKALDIIGNCDVTLEVRQSNIAAISLYKTHGFEIVGIRDKYYKDENAYIMKKESR